MTSFKKGDKVVVLHDPENSHLLTGEAEVVDFHKDKVVVRMSPKIRTIEEEGAVVWQDTGQGQPAGLALHQVVRPDYLKSS